MIKEAPYIIQMHAQLAVANLNCYPLLKKRWLRTHIASVYIKKISFIQVTGYFKNSDTQTQIALKNGVRAKETRRPRQAILFVLGQNTFFTYNFIKKPKIFVAFTLSSGRSGGRSVDLGYDAVLDLVAVARPRVSVFGLAPAVVTRNTVQKAEDGQKWHRPREEVPKS
jgi:hypothetical protein